MIDYSGGIARCGERSISAQQIRHINMSEFNIDKNERPKSELKT
jgi:hypothetical protein